MNDQGPGLPVFHAFKIKLLPGVWGILWYRSGKISHCHEKREAGALIPAGIPLPGQLTFSGGP